MLIGLCNALHIIQLMHKGRTQDTNWTRHWSKSHQCIEQRQILDGTNAGSQSAAERSSKKRASVIQPTWLCYKWLLPLSQVHCSSHTSPRSNTAVQEFHQS